MQNANYVLVVKYDNDSCLPSGNVCPVCCRINNKTIKDVERKSYVRERRYLHFCEHCGNDYIIKLTD